MFNIITELEGIKGGHLTQPENLRAESNLIAEGGYMSNLFLTFYSGTFSTIPKLVHLN